MSVAYDTNKNLKLNLIQNLKPNRKKLLTQLKNKFLQYVFFLSKHLEQCQQTSDLNEVQPSSKFSTFFSKAVPVDSFHVQNREQDNKGI